MQDFMIVKRDAATNDSDKDGEEAKNGRPIWYRKVASIG